ncbi:hypothetical protein NE235_27415 [Actinoallomurus spadix]|uniref:Transposase n=1 Tax=Actinoallomurus spadix TaxID=79912 RepID=A0ABP3H6J7_9ACTN|nr:hypothetical protein [Actinoallomurus spadix]MCO5989847.1 hypothetical protein [Actinoallomurus spadix]
MDFDTAADRLYGVPPAEFTATRKRLAGELPREDARRLTALRRPTVSAWAVNHLVRDGGVQPLLDLGERMREAWSSGGDLGALEHERGTLVDGLVRRARELAEEAERPLNEAQSREVEDTLQAALADPAAAEAVRAGRLEHPLSHAGFGPLGALAPSMTRRREPTAPKGGREKRAPTKGERAKRAPREHAPREHAERAAPEENARIRARRLAEEAQAAAERAEEAEGSLAQWRSERDAAREAVEAADRRLEELGRRLEELHGQVKAAEAERAEAGRHAQVVEREYDRAARTADEARRRAEEAAARRHAE